MTTRAAPDHLTCDRRDGFAVVTLNRPDRLNALSHELLTDLRTLLAELEVDPTIKAVVLTGAGRAFSAGADLRGGPSDTEHVLRVFYNPLIADMVAMHTPLVASVNGVAAGAGLALALACDLKVASQAASFELSFVKVGLVPDAGSTWLLPRVVGLSRAMEIALLGRRIPAEQALAWGLVNDVVAADELDDTVSAVAAQFAQLSSSVGPTKALLLEGSDSCLADQLDREATAQGLAQHSPDYAEARAAFAEKRKPTFR